MYSLRYDKASTRCTRQLPTKPPELTPAELLATGDDDSATFVDGNRGHDLQGEIPWYLSLMGLDTKRPDRVRSNRWCAAISARGFRVTFTNGEP